MSLPKRHDKIQHRSLLSDVPPTRGQARFSVWICGLLVVALFITIPFAHIPLPSTGPLLQAYATAIVFNDLLTAALLLALYSAQRSVALLILASGYILVGLLAVPWVLTFPGVVAELGLFGAGQQTTASIAALRRVGFPVFVLAYALLKDGFNAEDGPKAQRSWPSILLRVSAVSAFALGSTIVIIKHDANMPALMAGRMQASALWTYVAAISTALYILAIVVLWARLRSVLDIWLLVVLFTLLIEIILLSYISSGRLSVGWWAGRAYGLAAMSVVLILMLWETTTLYARLATSVAAERWARETRVTSLEALSASIAHEVNQPLASMVTNAGAGLLWLERPEPELNEAKAALGRIVDEGHRAGEIVESIRTLFRKDARERVQLNLNEIINNVLPQINSYARSAGVDVHIELAEDLRSINGNAVQLHQVIANLTSNAIEAMSNVQDRPRVLAIRTRSFSPHNALISVTDTGSGIEPEKAARLFEPFVTTKSSGLGMGLMICNSIVESHGGSIWTSVNMPNGTIFNVALPTSEEPSPEGLGLV